MPNSTTTGSNPSKSLKGYAWIQTITEEVIFFHTGDKLNRKELKAIKEGNPIQPGDFFDYLLSHPQPVQKRRNLVLHESRNLKTASNLKSLKSEMNRIDKALRKSKDKSAVYHLFPIYAGGSRLTDRVYSLFVLDTQRKTIIHIIPGKGDGLHSKYLLQLPLTKWYTNTIKAAKVATSSSFYLMAWLLEYLSDEDNNFAQIPLKASREKLKRFRKSILSSMEKDMLGSRVGLKSKLSPFQGFLREVGMKIPALDEDIKKIERKAIYLDRQADIIPQQRNLSSFSQQQSAYEKGKKLLLDEVIKVLDRYFEARKGMAAQEHSLGLIDLGQAFQRRGKIEWDDGKTFKPDWLQMEGKCLERVEEKREELEVIAKRNKSQQSEYKLIIMSLWRMELHLFLFDKNPIKTWQSLPPDYLKKLGAIIKAQLFTSEKELKDFVNAFILPSKSKSSSGKTSCPICKANFSSLSEEAKEAHIFFEHETEMREVLKKRDHSWNKVKEFHFKSTKLYSSQPYDNDTMMRLCLWFRGGMTTHYLNEIIKGIFVQGAGIDSDLQGIISDLQTANVLPTSVSTKDHWPSFNASGSTTPTSDIDVNLKGSHTPQITIAFNEYFRKKFEGLESGFVFDVNVYASDFMPDPGFRLMGPNKPGEKLDARSLSQQELIGHMYDFWSLLKIRRYWKDSDTKWQSFLKAISLGIKQFTVQLPDLKEKAEVWEKMGAKIDQKWTAIEQQLRDKESRLKSENQFSEAVLSDENFPIRKENEVYKDELIKSVRMRSFRENPDGLLDNEVKAFYDAALYNPPANQQRKFDNIQVILNEQFCRGNVAAQEGAHSRSYLRHVVQNLQIRQGVNASIADYLNSFNEQIADMLKEVIHVFHGNPTDNKDLLKEAGRKSSKYMLRTVYACEKLLEIIFRESRVQNLPALMVDERPAPDKSQTAWMNKVKKAESQFALVVKNIQQDIEEIREAGEVFLAVKKGVAAPANRTHTQYFNFIKKHEPKFIALAQKVNVIVRALVEVPQPVKKLYLTGVSLPNLSPSAEAKLAFDEVLGRIKNFQHHLVPNKGPSNAQQRLRADTALSNRFRKIYQEEFSHISARELEDLKAIWAKMLEYRPKGTYGFTARKLDSMKTTFYRGGHFWLTENLPKQRDDLYYPFFASFLSIYLKSRSLYPENKSAFDKLIRSKKEDYRAKWIEEYHLTEDESKYALLNRLLLELALGDLITPIILTYGGSTDTPAVSIAEKVLFPLTVAV